jgi:phosphopantothenoylcysteine decarboxylase/phosphopantothenate--cysteine ligase
MEKTFHVLVSAGPTRERIDPVRFLSNRSTGRMGYAIASAARDFGCRVTLVSGPVSIPEPDGVEVFRVESAAEMATAVKHHSQDADLIIMAAAVADYRPKRTFDQKMKKGTGDLVLELERTEDILAWLGKNRAPGQCLVGFAAETENLLDNALRKLSEKNLDWIVLNNIGLPDRGFAVETNEVTLLHRDGHRVHLPLADKSTIARKIVGILTGKVGVGVGVGVGVNRYRNRNRNRDRDRDRDRNRKGRG